MQGFDVEQVKKFATRLKAIIKAKSEGESGADIRNILNKLEDIRKPTLELLSQTKIGVPVAKLANKAKTPKLHADLRSRASKLVVAWKKRAAKLSKRGPTKIKKAVVVQKKKVAAAASKPARSPAPSSRKPKADQPPPGSTPDEQKAFFLARFGFWNRDLNTDKIRVKRRHLIFDKLALHRAKVRSVVGELSDEEFFLLLIDTAENIESEALKAFGKNADMLQTKLMNVVHGLQSNVHLVENLLTKVNCALHLFHFSPQHRAWRAVP